MKLAASHWAKRPQDMDSRYCEEERRVIRLLGGRVQESGLQIVRYREVWMDGDCRHVVLDVATRRRLDVRCPDCSRVGLMAVLRGPVLPPD